MHELATRALQNRSPRLLREGLVESLRRDERAWLVDERDLLMWLAPLHDCARRLGLDPAAELAAAADAGPPSLREAVCRFGERTDVSERSFCFRVSPDGVYEPEEPVRFEP